MPLAAVAGSGSYRSFAIYKFEMVKQAGARKVQPVGGARHEQLLAVPNCRLEPVKMTPDPRSERSLARAISPPTSSKWSRHAGLNLRPLPIAAALVCLIVTSLIGRIECQLDRPIGEVPPTQAPAPAMENELATTSAQLPGEQLTSEQRLLMSTRLPRQHFRVHMMPSARKSTFKLVKIQKSRAPSGKNSATSRAKSATTTTTTTTTIAPTSSASTSSTAAPLGEMVAPIEQVDKNDISQLPRKPLQRGQGKKISSAVLRKLLSQTLPKLNASSSSSSSSSLASAGNASNPTKGPNFKFVFIQRGSSAQPVQTDGSASAPTKGANGPRQASLAASVSKQLASSLLYSAANLVGNLTGASSSAAGAALAPSLSALAALVQQPQRGDQSSEPSKEPLAASGSTTDALIDGQNNDIKRLTEPPQQRQTPASKGKAAAAAATKTRPSKIYNLPVKFVSNGQPNHVMFHTIKQHFAAIKRLQQSVNGQQAAPDGNSGSNLSTKRRRPQAGRNRLKGKDSRLIYLPLKYLSNARPSMLNVVMGNKASHKSSPRVVASGGGGGTISSAADAAA